LGEQVFDDYITSVQARMQRDGQIKINKDVLAKVAEDEPTAPPRPTNTRATVERMKDERNASRS
jgi:hypothetical protein